MAYDWEKNGESDRADKLSAGEHTLTIIKVITEKNDIPYQSKAGDPQILLVYQDDDGRELPDWFTLNPASRWKLLRLMSRCGCDLERAEKEVGNIKNFADPDTVEPWLLDKAFLGRVYEENGYTNVEPLKREEDTIGNAPLVAPETPHDDIPF